MFFYTFIFGIENVQVKSLNRSSVFMKKILFFLMFSTIISAQSFYPALNLSGMSMDSFLPQDWKLISNAVGDLNNDKLIDFALVIEKKRNYFQ